MAEGQDQTTGRFLPGHSLGKGRPKGSRNKMTQRMLDRVAERSEDGLSMEEIMMDIAQDMNQPAELRIKAAKAIMDVVYPKASSVEVKMDDEGKLSKDQIDQRLRELLGSLAVNKPDEGEED